MGLNLVRKGMDGGKSPGERFVHDYLNLFKRGVPTLAETSVWG